MQEPEEEKETERNDDGDDDDDGGDGGDGADNKWEELLRRMLPAGAPLPDEEHLDYSIAVEYQGPPPQFGKKINSFSSFNKTPKFTPSFKKYQSPSSFCQRSNLSITKAYKDRWDYSMDQTEGNSNVEIETSFSASSSTLFNLFAIDNIDKVEEFEDNNDAVISCDTDSRRIGKKTKKSKFCNRCKKRINLVFKRERGERCLVCNALYCRNCVLRGMGSMPEGRKCVGCIGKPIDEAKRDGLGKCSRLLDRICSPLEFRQIMKAEKECPANQVRPEQVVVNGRPLRAEELADILKCANPPQNLRTGKYWYDKDSGLWGKEGEKPELIISAKLNVGGKLPVYASNGNTKVYINGREITKVELKVLRLLKVQCPRDTRFWLYEDGSYEEEGQNNIKGNIWTKVYNRSVCSLYSLPVPPENPPKEDRTTFSGRTVPECLGHGKVQKLLLLGLEGSGTSTIFKQMKFIHGNKYTAEELQHIKLRIQSNIYRYLSILLEGQECFEDEVFLGEENPDFIAERSAQNHSITSGDIFLDKCHIYSVNGRFKIFSDWLLTIMATGDLDAVFPSATHEYAALVDEVWKDPAIQETYKRRDELCLPDVAKYFLDRANEISRSDYEPSEDDILYAEGVIPINGLSFLEFTSDDHSPISETYNKNYELQFPLTRYQLVHMGFKDTRFKWLEMLDGFRAVAYCVALTDYDQIFTKDANKMLASKVLFENLVKHTSFEETPFVLLLNKYDAFEKKIKHVPLTVCGWFSDFRPLENHQHSSQSLAQQAYYYIAMKFKALYTSITGRKLFVWQSRARDRASVDDAFRYIKEVIRWEEEKYTDLYGISGNDTFDYSTEISSPYFRQC